MNMLLHKASKKTLFQSAISTFPSSDEEVGLKRKLSKKMLQIQRTKVVLKKEQGSVSFGRVIDEFKCKGLR